MFASTRHTRSLQHPLHSLLLNTHAQPHTHFAHTHIQTSHISSTTPTLSNTPSSTSSQSPSPPISPPISSPQTIFSGIQPTGIPHLGNYLGALRTWVSLQDSAAPSTKLFFSVVDLHAITLFQKPEELRRWRRESMAALLACGIDESRSCVFWQGQVCEIF